MKKKDEQAVFSFCSWFGPISKTARKKAISEYFYRSEDPLKFDIVISSSYPPEEYTGFFFLCERYAYRRYPTIPAALAAYPSFVKMRKFIEAGIDPRAIELFRGSFSDIEDIVVIKANVERRALLLQRESRIDFETPVTSFPY